MPRLSDKTTRSSILLSTRWLPQPLRVRARADLLGRLELGKLMRAQHVIIGHPKSGNTWLRTMISRLYQIRYGLPASLVLKSDELANANAAIPRFCVANGHHSYEGVVKKTLADPTSPFSDRRVLLLSRNPLDIAVSWYLQFTKRISPAKRELINAALARPIDWQTISMWDFVRHSEIGLESLIEFLNEWQRVVARLPHSRIFRYEDLRLRTAETLGEILSFFELPFSAEEIRKAVEFGSFENLQKLEDAGFFRRGGLAIVRPDDPESRKVRRGKIGGYRDDFTAKQAAELEELVREKLSPVFGYDVPGRATVPVEESSSCSP